MIGVSEGVIVESEGVIGVSEGVIGETRSSTTQSVDVHD